ncbi:hypothetical protein [Candidatus Albibeggiatoa sp. nov. NOAA]|uniref:hypothetical protein n=1 Tax=Candidatus Albibeggiatoa sp. nov. NOAA TaxID=3162724 RepID=UPI0032F3A435|nr:hypothetical protein [Thiotrichaceae bacterium]
MPSLQETVEQQAVTIQQLTDIVAKSEARHRSLERMIRWMGVGVFVLAIMFAIPMKQNLFSEAHANNDPQPMPTCGQLPQMPCDQVQAMAMNMFGQMMAQVGKELAPLAEQVLGHSDGFLELIGARIRLQMAEDIGSLINTTTNELKSVSNIDQQEKDKLAKAVVKASKLLAKAKAVATPNEMLAELDKATTKLVDVGNALAKAEQEQKLTTKLESLIRERMQTTHDIQEKRKIIDVGAKMTLMDHIANIDYDFDNLTTIGRVIPQLINDMNNMSDKMDNMSNRMDTMARDMHNMNSMAFDIHNMAATGVPVMGRMNNATSWMPWW